MQRLSNMRLSGDLRTDAVALLQQHGYVHTAGHSARVAAEAERLTAHYGLDTQAVFQAGWLHDISAIVPNNERIVLAEQLGLEILPEERQLHWYTHGLSLRISNKLRRMMDDMPTWRRYTQVVSFALENSSMIIL